MNAQQKSLDFLGIQAKILGLQRYLVMRLRESRLEGIYDSDQTDDEKLSAQMRLVMETGRPLCIAMDGNLPLVQDVGGIHGYCDFLKTINGEDANARQEMLEWARGLGWTGRRQTAERLL